MTIIFIYTYRVHCGVSEHTRKKHPRSITSKDTYLSPGKSGMKYKFGLNNSEHTENIRSKISKDYNFTTCKI